MFKSKTKGGFIYSIGIHFYDWKFTLFPMMYFKQYNKGYCLELGFFTLFIEISKIQDMRDNENILNMCDNLMKYVDEQKG